MSTIDPFELFKELVLNLRISLQRSKVVNVNSIVLRDDARRVVQLYFRTIRSVLEKLECSMEEILQLDGFMQSLLRLSNGCNARRSYLKVVSAVIQRTETLEIQREMQLGRFYGKRHGISNMLYSEREAQIISTLGQMVPSAALSYEQALIDLNDPNRVSYRGSANELRECLREVLDKLAPDNAVLESAGFQFEKGRDRPTQKQKVRFILRSRLLHKNAIKVPEDALKCVDESISSLARSLYERSSLSAHVETTKNEVHRIKDYINLILVELLALTA